MPGYARSKELVRAYIEHTNGKDLHQAWTDNKKPGTWGNCQRGYKKWLAQRQQQQQQQQQQQEPAAAKTPAKGAKAAAAARGGDTSSTAAASSTLERTGGIVPSRRASQNRTPMLAEWHTSAQVPPWITVLAPHLEWSAHCATPTASPRLAR